MTKKHCNAKSKKIIQIDEEQVKDHLGEIVDTYLIRCVIHRHRFNLVSSYE